MELLIGAGIVLLGLWAKGVVLFKVTGVLVNLLLAVAVIVLVVGLIQLIA